jgi:hypothetical protein
LIATASGLLGAAIVALLLATVDHPAPAALPAQTAAGEARLDLIGQIGGEPSDVAVADDIAYMSVGMHVWAVDVSDPTAPRLMAQSKIFPGYVGQVRATGDGLLAVSYPLDSAESAQVTLLGPAQGGVLPELGRASLDTRDVWDLEVDGTRAVFRGDRGLTYLDVAKPAQLQIQALPALLPPTGTGISGIIFVGGLLYEFVYLTDQPAGRLQVLDLADPSQPQLVGQADIGGRQPVIDDDVLYAIQVEGQSPPRFEVIDVADPRKPRLLSQTPIMTEAANLVGMGVEAGYATFVNRFGEILVYDLADPLNPRRIATVKRGSLLEFAVGAGNRLFIVGDAAIAGRAGLAILDRSEPDTLPVLGRLDVPPIQISGLAIVDDTLFVAGRHPIQVDHGALWALDISTPSRPVPLDTLQIPVAHSKLARDGQTLFASSRDTGLNVVDIADPAHLRLRGIAPEGTEGMVVEAGNGYVYVRCCQDRQLLPIDVHDLDHPIALPPTDFWNSPTGDFDGLRLSGDYLIGARGDLVTIDIREPRQPRLVRRDDFGQRPYGVADVDADGTRAVAAVTSTVRIFDTATLSGMHEIGAINLSRDVDKVALSGDIVMALTSGSILTAIDIAQPSTPRVLATAQLPHFENLGGAGDLGDIAIAGDVLAVAGFQGAGVFIVRLTRPEPMTPSPTPPPTPTRGARRVFLPTILNAGFVTRRTGELEPLGHWDGAVGALAMDGDTMLAIRSVASSMPNKAQLVTLDFSDPAAPVELGASEAFPAARLPDPTTLVAAGGYAYLPRGDDGLAVIDVRDVRRPHVVASLFAGDDCYGLSLAGGYGYLYGYGDVRVLDMANPAAPYQVGVIPSPLTGDTSAVVTSVAVHEKLAWVGYYLNSLTLPGLMAWDIANPAHPRPVASALPGVGVADIVLHGQRAYVSSATDQPGRPLTHGLVVLDVSDPTHLIELGHRLDDHLSVIQRIEAIDEDTLLLGPWGAYVWDVSHPRLPRELTRIAADGSLTDLMVAGDRVYMAGAGLAADHEGPGIAAYRWTTRP